MNTTAVVDQGYATPEQALEVFDALGPVNPDFMLGAWQGSGLHTDHPMDGLLEAFHWHGKHFDSSESVHPLVFRSLSGGTRCLNPRFMGASLGLVGKVPTPKSAIVGKIFQLLMPLLSTRKPRARLRMTEYRGKSSATMVYDQLPINDVFRKVDDQTVMGAMDLRGLERPFFFVLRRETTSAGDHGL